MSDEFELHAELRTDVGKGASRRLRHLSDLVPAIIYGAGKEAVAVTFTQKDLQKALNNEAFYSHIVTIKMGRKKDQVVLKDLQRHPSQGKVLHADFLRVSMDQKITINVPIHFINEEECIGVKQEGGEISHMLGEIEISCLPGDLPEYIDVDMAEIALGDSIHLSDLKLPGELEIVALQHSDRPDQLVAAVHTMRAEEIEEVDTELEEGLEGEEGVEGAEGEEGEEGAAPADESGEEDK